MTMPKYSLPKSKTRTKVTPGAVIGSILGILTVAFAWFAVIAWWVMLLLGGLASETGWDVNVSYAASSIIVGLTFIFGYLLNPTNKD